MVGFIDGHGYRSAWVSICMGTVTHDYLLATISAHGARVNGASHCAGNVLAAMRSCSS